MTCGFDEKDGTYCSKHKCGFADPCMKRDCPHCGEAPNRRHARLAQKLLNAQAKVERWEKRVGLAVGRLIDARAELARLRRRISKLDATVDLTDMERMKEVADGITGNGEPVEAPLPPLPSYEEMERRRAAASDDDEGDSPARRGDA